MKRIIFILAALFISACSYGQTSTANPVQKKEVPPVVLTNDSTFIKL